MYTIKQRIEENQKTKDVLTPELLVSVNDNEEYIKDNDIYCKKCNTRRTRFLFERKIRIQCKCQVDAAEEAKQNKIRLERIESVRKACLMPERYKLASFDATDVYSPEYGVVYNRCKKYTEVAEEVLERGLGIYLHGDNGVGKSHLAACIANELMNNSYSAIFTSMGDISKRIRSSYGKRKSGEFEFMEKLARVDFLFIDDLGTELVAKEDKDLWLQEKVFEVVNGRYNAKKPIIITSNYSFKELAKDRGVAVKTIDRLAEICEPMQIKGASYRSKVKAKNHKLF